MTRYTYKIYYRRQCTLFGVSSMQVFLHHPAIIPYTPFLSCIDTRNVYWSHSLIMNCVCQTCTTSPMNTNFSINNSSFKFRVLLPILEGISAVVHKVFKICTILFQLFYVARHIPEVRELSDFKSQVSILVEPGWNFQARL